MSLEIRAAVDADLADIARLSLARSQEAATRCLHADTSPTLDAVTAEILELIDAQELVYVVAREPRLVGLLGCELVADQGRGWLRGPFAPPGDGFLSMATGLYATLREILPPQIRRLDTFLHEANRAGDAFYRSRGFHLRSRAHIYATDARDPVTDADGCQLLTEAHFEPVVALHDALFPATYASGREIVDRLAAERQVLVALRHGALAGYTRVLHGSEDEGYVEYVGVRPEARRRGVGRQLLQAGLAYLMGERRCARVTLTVNDDNVNARHLYESVGFRLVHTGVNLRLEG